MPRYLRRGVSALRRTYLAITLGSKMEVGAGIEPTSNDYKSTVLPLNYQPVGMPERDSNPRHKD